MQFSFLGFSVKKVMELELDVKDLAILRYFQDFMKSGKMNNEVIDGVKYYWISYKNISEEMPFLGLGKRTIMMRMLRLRDLGLLSHYTKKEGGTFSYYTLGDKFNELLYTSESRTSINEEEGNKNGGNKYSGNEIYGQTNTNSRRNIYGQSNRDCVRNISGQGKNNSKENIREQENKNSRSNTSGQSKYSEEVKDNEILKDTENIMQVDSNNIQSTKGELKSIGEAYGKESVIVGQAFTESHSSSIQVNFEEIINNEQSSAVKDSNIKEQFEISKDNNLNSRQVIASENNKTTSNDKEEVINNFELPNQNNSHTLSKEINKGYSPNDTTKTNLLNNSSTINTNDLKSIKDKIDYILNYLNTKANVNYRITNRKTVNLITARLREGFTVEDFKIVIDKKVSDWKDTDFEQYLNPFTLFADKFELYLNQKVSFKNKNSNGGTAGGNSISSKGKKNNSDPKKLRFNNFAGRDFDYEKIEDQLLGWV